VDKETTRSRKEIEQWQRKIVQAEADCEATVGEPEAILEAMRAHEQKEQRSVAAKQQELGAEIAVLRTEN
jgi:hypothetical protein